MNEKKEKAILFLCTGNSCRSQMAEGFAKAILPKGWKVYSAGTFAVGVHPVTTQVMREVGFDISDQYSKTIDAIPVEDITYTVTLCDSARDRCPAPLKGSSHEHWPIADPIGTGGDQIEAFRKTRDDILQRMKELAKRLKKITPPL